MADAPNEPKADLKSRLGLKSRAAPSAAPIVPGAPPPEPPKPKVEKPTAATIDEARRHAAEAEKAAGPAIEQFQFGAPEKTPLPSALPTGPRVEYVEVKGSEELPEAAKKRRLQLILACVFAALGAFIIGRMMGSSSVRSAMNDSAVLEAEEKKKLFESKKVTFENIAAMKAALEKVDTQVRLLDPEKGDITTLEKDFTELIIAMGKFAGNKQSSIEPSEVLSGQIYNGELMKVMVGFAYQTRSFQDAVAAGVEEAKSLFLVNPVPPPDRQKLLAIAEPDQLEAEGLGKVPLSKGTIVIQAGRPEAVVTKDATGADVTEFYQVAKVEGREKPVQIKTTQMVQVDMAPFWDKQAKGSKRTMLARLATISAQLLDQAKKIDTKAAQAEIDKFLNPPAE